MSSHVIRFLRLASSALLAADQPDRLPQRSERLHREEEGKRAGIRAVHAQFGFKAVPLPSMHLAGVHSQERERDEKGLRVRDCWVPGRRCTGLWELDSVFEDLNFFTEHSSAAGVCMRAVSSAVVRFPSSEGLLRNPFRSSTPGAAGCLAAGVADCSRDSGRRPLSAPCQLDGVLVRSP
ncbi:hypothetical protein EYF80_037304 [Liparis tanakae]|uniref:Secreted protein n=1 Tax=Liparis tanakae TaxID=230148 RepID=A0A4Z2GG17_9TELE|nr:hypothetical protein EYF80_037304 [Liparis tanakae]